jgi:hypothetical protein
MRTLEFQRYISMTGKLNLFEKLAPIPLQHRGNLCRCALTLNPKAKLEMLRVEPLGRFGGS